MAKKRNSSQTILIFLLATTIILISTFGLYTTYLLWGDWTYDQGFYFVVARLMDKGFTPYAEIHMSEQPLMAWSTHLSFQLFGSIWGMQFLMVGYAMLGVTALIDIGRSLDGKLTGLLAGLLIVSHFEFFQATRLVNPETTSLSLALVAVALALRYRSSEKRVWLLVSAIAMAGSFLLKLFMVVTIPLIALILAFYPSNGTIYNFLEIIKHDKKRILQDYGLWFGLTLAILLVTWLSVGFSAWLEQSVMFYINRNAAYTRDLAFNLSQIWGLLSDWPILFVLTLWGLGRTALKFKQFGWVIFCWTIFTLIFLMSFTPLRSKHLIMLLPPLALLAALALSHLINFWRSQKKSRILTKWVIGVALVVLVILLGQEIATPFRRLAKPIKPLVEAERQPIVEVLQKFTTPNDCIITDDPYIAFVADRMPPPWLSNMSYARFSNGSLDTQALIDITESYNCQVVIPTFDRLKNSNRAYYDLAKAHYLRVWLVDGAEIMLGKPLTTANPTLPIYANFNNEAELLGIDWIKSDAGRSKQTYLSLYWKKLEEPFSQNYKIFVQLRDQTGQTLASADHELFDGLVQTNQWRVGTITKDTNRLNLPETIQQGEYTLYIGLYNPETLERLPVIDDTSGENAAVISGILIQRG